MEPGLATRDRNPMPERVARPIGQPSGHGTVGNLRAAGPAPLPRPSPARGGGEKCGAAASA